MDDNNMSNMRFSITPAKAVCDTELSDSVFRTLAALGVFGNKEGWCWPGLALLGEMLGKSKQAVSSDIHVLEDRGYLNIHPRFDEKTKARKSNIIQIRFDYPLSKPPKSPPSSPEVDTPSNPEVDVNAPLNAPLNESTTRVFSGDVFKVYESEIGIITPRIRDAIGDYLDDLKIPTEWIVEAIQIAATQNKRNWAYCAAILKRWAVEGKTALPPKPQPRGPKYPKGDRSDLFEKLEKA